MEYTTQAPQSKGTRGMEGGRESPILTHGAVGSSVNQKTSHDQQYNTRLHAQEQAHAHAQAQVEVAEGWTR